MTYLVFVSLGLAGVAIIGWIKAREDAREWAQICVALGNEYDKMVLELAHRTSKVNVVEQRSQWLN